MRAYPTVKDTPNRKQRKTLRKKIFEENQDAMKKAREVRRLARIGGKNVHNG